MNDAVLSLSGVERRYRQGERVLKVLNGAELDVRIGEVVALIGPSGSGKSTLLHVAGLLERPDGGRVRVGGTDCQTLGDGARTAIRREVLGFVYQFHHLLPEFSAVENVLMANMIAGKPRRAAYDRARELLIRVGLAERLQHRPGQLSGGEQQRVAIARALANEPRLLLADEPTGNLDPGTADRVMGQLLELVRGDGLAALIATHNPEIAARADRVVTLEDGHIVAARGA